MEGTRSKISGLISGRNHYSFCSAISLKFSLGFRSPFHQFRNKTFTFVTHIFLSRYVIITIHYFWTCYKIQNNWIIVQKIYKQVFSGSITDCNMCIYKRFRLTILDVNHLTPNDHYMGRTAQLTSRWCIYIFIQQIYVLNILDMLHNLPFFLFKMQFIS